MVILNGGHLSSWFEWNVLIKCEWHQEPLSYQHPFTLDKPKNKRKEALPTQLSRSEFVVQVSSSWTNPDERVLASFHLTDTQKTENKRRPTCLFPRTPNMNMWELLSTNFLFHKGRAALSVSRSADDAVGQKREVANKRKRLKLKFVSAQRRNALKLTLQVQVQCAEIWRRNWWNAVERNSPGKNTSVVMRERRPFWSATRQTINLLLVARESLTQAGTFLSGWCRCVYHRHWNKNKKKKRKRTVTVNLESTNPQRNPRLEWMSFSCTETHTERGKKLMILEQASGRTSHWIFF